MNRLNISWLKQDTTHTTGNVKVIGNSNVKQLVIYSAKSGSVQSKIIDARDDYWINLPIKDGSGFVFIIGVPN